MNVETRRLCFEGTAVRFKIYTPENNAVLSRAAFCCSTLGDCESWDGFCSRLCKSGTLCVTFEMPGFGHTPLNAPQDNKTRAGILWGVLDVVEEERGEAPHPWHLIGHGSGCAVVLTMAAQHPKSTRSRVLISPTVPRLENGLVRMCVCGKIGRFLLSRVFRAYYHDRTRFEQKMREVYSPDVPPEIVDRYYREFRRKGRFETIMESLKYGYRVSEKAWKLQGPLLVLAGGKDCYGRKLPGSIDRKLEDREFHCFKDGGHMIIEEQPSVMHEYVQGWFDDCDGRRKAPAHAGGK